MRKALGLLILLGLVIGLFFLAGRLRGLHFTVSGQPGDLLYAAAFAEGSDGWSTYDDGRLSALAENGSLLVRANQASSAAFSAGPFWFEDVTIQTAARAIEGPLDNGFGLMVALQTQENQRPDDDAYLLFLISSDGYYAVRQRLNGAEQVLSTWIPSAAIQTGLGVDNDLTVTLADGLASFSVNGQPLAFCVPNQPDGVSTYYLDQCVDGHMLDALPVAGAGPGQVGVVALTTASGGPGVAVRFGGVSVLAP
ncbi:MAG: hypothetical protein JNL34_13040 [Anaerolineae bacterium]|nr:hypothetical protein [Anaerolineae bacterium]